MFQGEWEQSDDDVTTHVDNSKHHIRQNDMNGIDDDAIMWHSNSITDSGPLLRRDYVESKLTKMERYLLV